MATSNPSFAPSRLRALLDASFERALTAVERREFATLLPQAPTDDTELQAELELLITALASDVGLAGPASDEAAASPAERTALWDGIAAYLPQPPARNWWHTLLGDAPRVRWAYTAAAVACFATVAVIATTQQSRQPPYSTDKGASGVAALAVDAVVARRDGARWVLEPGAAATAVSSTDALIVLYVVDRAGYLGLARIGDDDLEVILPDETGSYAVQAGRRSIESDGAPAGIELAGLAGPQLLVVLWKATPLTAEEVAQLARRVAGSEPAVRNQLEAQGVTFGLVRLTVGP